MASAVKYLSNVTKSIKYATVDVLKELNPVILEGVEENADVAKVTYSTIKNFKTLVPKAAKSLSQSQVGELAKEAKRNIIEDIKSGTFYNREREQKMTDQAADAMIDDDYTQFMADDDDLGFDTESNEFLADAMDEVGEKASNAVNQVLVRTAEYQVEATRQSTTRMLAQTAAMNATLHSDLTAVNANIAGVVKFNQEVMATHVENSRMFYERQQQQMSEQIALLTEIRDIQKSVFSPSKKGATSKVSVSDIFTSNGMINLADYFKYVQQNIKEADSGIGDFIQVFGELGLGRAAVANPLGSVMKGIIKTAIPKVLKDAMSELNDSISGGIATALLNITKQKDSYNGFLSTLGNIFGLDLSVKRGINTGNYNKDAVPWNGKDHKALTEVIPTLLSKIYSSVSGQKEIRYDYSAGRFKSMKEIKRDFQRTKDRYVVQANDTIMPYMKEGMAKVDFKNDKKRKQEFIDTLEQVLRYNFEHMEKFNPRDKSKTAKTYGLKGEHAEYDLKLIREIIAKIPKSKQLRNQQDLIEAAQAFNRFLTDEEESGDSIYNALSDGSMSKGKGKKGKLGSPIFAAASKIDTTNQLLTEIRDYLYTPANKRNRLKKGKIYNDNRTVGVISTSEKKKDDKIKSNMNLDVTQKDKTTMSIDDEINLDEQLTEQSKLIKDLKKATTATEKLKALFKNGSLILTKPAEFAAGLIRKVDNRLYNILFSEDEDDTGSVMGKLKERFDDWFEDLKKTTKQKFEGIKEAIGESGVKGKFSSIMKNLFGFDFQKWEGEFKEALFGDKDTSFVSGLRDIFSKGFREMFDGFKKFFKSETEEQEVARKTNRANKDIAKAFSSLGETKEEGSTKGAASGMKRVTKTGVVAVSEGEMIIPPDMNPAKIKQRSAKEKKAIEEFEKVYGPIGIEGYAAGGQYKSHSQVMYEELLKRVQAGWSKSKLVKWAKENIPDETIRRKILEKAQSETAQYAKNRAKNAAKKVMDFGSAMGEEAKEFANNARENEFIDNLVTKISGKVQKTIPEGGKDVVKDVLGNFKSYLPRIAASGATGMGLSLLLGLAGGPILGAAVGAGVGLLSKSEKLQTWLFGKELEDGSGRDGSGVIPKNITQNLNKYFPNMAKGAIVGGITSVLPFVPGGPMAGILVGSAVGFARSNENLKNKLFGKEDKLGNAVKILKQKLPKMGLGAAVGFLAGPFGLTTNLMLGAGLGFVSDTEKFKDIVFGTKGFDGKRDGGLVGFIKDAVEIPINGIKDLFGYAKGWFKKDILDPMKRFIQPALQDMKNLGQWIKDGIKSAFRDHLLRPIGATINNKIIRPIEEKIGKLVTPLIKGIMGVVSMPFRALGRFGDWRRSRQLRSVGGAAGTTAERVAARVDLDNNRKPNIFKRAINRAAGREVFSTAKHVDSEAQRVDMALMGMSDEDAQMLSNLSEIYENTGMTKGKNAKKKREKNIKANLASLVRKEGSLDRLIYKHVDKTNQTMVDEYNTLKDRLLEGDSATCISIIQSWTLAGKFPSEYEQAAIDGIKKNVKLIKARRARLENIEGTIKEFEQKYGINLRDRKHRKVVKQRAKELGLDNDKAMEDYFQNVADAANEGSISEQQLNVAFKMEALQKETNSKLEDIHETLKSILNKNKDINESPEVSEELDEQVENEAKAAYKGKLLPALYGTEYQPNFVMVDADEVGSATKKSRFGFADKFKSRGKDVWENLTNSFKSAIQSVQDRVKPSASDIVALAQAGDYSAANNLASGRIRTADRLRSVGRSIVNKIRKTASMSKTVMTESGPVLMRRDAQGNEIPDERDSETKETLAIQGEQRETQKGILSKISGLGDRIKGFFGFGDDEKDDDSESWFSKILKKAAPALLGIGALGVAGTIADKKINVKKRDEQGNVVYDENGNPVMVETTIADAVGDAFKRVWLGDDGTGNTDGIWFHIKGFTRDKVIPAIGAGIDIILKTLPNILSHAATIITDALPKIVEMVVSGLVEHAPSIVFGGIKGLGSGIVKGIANVFGGEDEKAKAEDINEQEYTPNVSLLNADGTKASTGSTSNLTPTSQSIVSAMQSAMDNSGAYTVSLTNTSTPTVDTTLNLKTTDVPQLLDVSGGKGSSSSNNTGGSTNIVSPGTATGASTTSNIAPTAETLKEVENSKAMKNTNSIASEKAKEQLASIWNQQTSLGMTVGEIANSDDTVIAYVPGSDGEQVPVYGSDLLNNPQIAKDLFGINIDYTDEELDENTMETHPELVFDRGATGAATDVITGLGRIAVTGGRAGAALKPTAKIINKVFNTAGDVFGKIPMPFKFNKGAKYATKAAGMAMSAPLYGANVFRDFMKSYSSGSSAKQAARDAFSNVADDIRGATNKAGQKAGKKFGKWADRARKARDAVHNMDQAYRNASGKATDWFRNFTQMGREQGYGNAARAARDQAADAMRNKASDLFNRGKAGASNTARNGLDRIKNIPSNVKNRFTNFVDNTKNTASNIRNRAGNIGNKARNAWSGVKGVYDSVKTNGWKQTGKNLYNTGVDKLNNWADNLWETPDNVEVMSGDVLDADGNVISRADDAAEMAADTASDMYDNSTIRQVTNKGDDMVEAATDATSKLSSQDTSKLQRNTSNALSTLRNKGDDIVDAATDAASSAGSKGGKLTGKAADVVEKMTKLISEFLSDNTVVNKLMDVLKSAKKKVGKEAIEEALKKFAKKITERFTTGIMKAGAKIVAKISTKLASYIGSGGLLTIAFAIKDFLMGFKNADAILEATDPTLAERFVAALVHTFTETFLIGLVLDSNTIMTSAIDLLEGLGMNFDDLRERQAEAKRLTEEYNRKHGTNLSPYEYMMEGKIETKIKKAAVKVWNSRPMSLVRGTVESGIEGVKAIGSAAWSNIKGTASGIMTVGKGIIGGGGKILKGDILGGLKDIGGGILGGAKKVGGGIIGSVKSLGKGALNMGKSLVGGVKDFFFGKDDKKEKKKEEKAEEQVQEEAEETAQAEAATDVDMAVSSKVESAASQMTTSGEQLFYDDAGNVVGSGLNENGVMEQSYVPQGDGAETTDQTQMQQQPMDQQTSSIALQATSGTGSLLNASNQKAINQLSTQVNSGIPGLIQQLKSNLARFFGVDASSFGKTKNIASNRYKGADPSSFFTKLGNMWKSASSKANPVLSTLPKAIGSATKELSHFLAVGFGLADPSEKNIDLAQATNATYLDRRAETIAQTSAFSATLGGMSLTGSNSADPNTQMAALENQGTSQATSTLGSKIKSYIGNIFGMTGGSGSGLSGDAPTVGDNPDSRKAETFISQRYSRYANRPFTISGDSKRETVADAGCAPAAATMAINNLGTVAPLDMNTAIKHAIGYKKPGGGVTADYFIDEFKQHGLQSAFVAGNDQKKESIIMNQLRQGNPIILMGQDTSNSTKHVSPFGPNTHYVVATGLSPDGKYVYINDPESRTPKTRYSLRRVMKGTILGVAPKPLSKTSRISSAADKKARSILKKFGASSKYGEDTIQYQVWQGLRSAGYNEIASAAAMGNIQHESAFNPATIEGNGTGPGFGLVQWTNPNGGSTGRRTNMENYAKERGKDPSDLTMQIEYLMLELEEGSGVWMNASSKYGFGSLSRKDWADGKDIEISTKAFMCCFERPSYDPGTNHIDRRISSAKEYYEAFTGTPISGGTSGSSDGTSESSESNNPITKLLSAFGQLGAAYGLTEGSTSGSSDSTSSTTATGSGEISEDVHGNVSSNPEWAEKQMQMANMMKQYEGQIQYSWGPGTKYDGPTRDPSKEIDGKRYGDCSSTVQWVYKSILGADPGVNTYTQINDSDTYTVGNGTSDESKLQLGDLLLKDGHVEMYYGDGRMIGHGGGGDGKTPGPTIKNLGSNPPYSTARRWIGFKEGGSGSGLHDTFSTNKISGSKNNTIYRRKWVGGGSGTGLTSSGSDTNAATAIPTTTVRSKQTPIQTNQNISIQSSDRVDKLIEVVIKLLAQVVSNTSSIQDIASLLVNLINMKSSDGVTSENNLKAIGNEFGKMKALISYALDSSKDGSNDQNIARLIDSVEAIARQ